jgi:hypothetical protein
VARIETPDVIQVAAERQQHLGLNADNLAKLNGGGSSPAVAPAAAAPPVPTSAVNLSAELSVKNLIDDLTELMEHLKVFLDPIATETGSVN